MSNIRKNKNSEAKNAAKGKRGRPKAKPKEKTMEENIVFMAEIGATTKAIAQHYGMDENTFKRHFEIFLTKGRENLKNTIRKKQIEVALNGNPAMLIWCGKQFAGQNDKGGIEETDEKKEDESKWRSEPRILNHG